MCKVIAHLYFKVFSTTSFLDSNVNVFIFRLFSLMLQDLRKFLVHSKLCFQNNTCLTPEKNNVLLGFICLNEVVWSR